MPAKTHRTGQLQAHHRSSSAGSSKMGLNNLQFTAAKDPGKNQDKSRRNGHTSEIQHTTSPHPRVPRVSSTSKVSSRDHIQHIPQKRNQAPAPTKRSGPGGRADFSLSTSVGTDEDGWVSSESGAVTPADSSEHGGETPVDRKLDHLQLQADHFAGTTPRAESSMTRVETARLSQPVHQSFSRTQPSSPVERFHPPPSSSIRPNGDSKSEMHVRVHDQPQMQPQFGRPSFKGFLTRRSSAYSDYVPEAPPHPLIRQPLSRGQSYHGAIKPAALAPLTVNAQPVQAEISSSPPLSARTSPSMLFSPSRTQSPALTNSQYARSSRRTSFSSAHSTQNLPAGSIFRGSPGSRTPRDRNRTLSTASVASMSALSSLNALPAMSRPGTPPLVSHFPAEDTSFGESHHPLVPAAYVANHMTVLAHYNPLPLSYERVMRAKARRS